VVFVDDFDDVFEALFMDGDIAGGAKFQELGDETNGILIANAKSVGVGVDAFDEGLEAVGISMGSS